MGNFRIFAVIALPEPVPVLSWGYADRRAENIREIIRVRKPDRQTDILYRHIGRIEHRARLVYPEGVHVLIYRHAAPAFEEVAYI